MLQGVAGSGEVLGGEDLNSAYKASQPMRQVRVFNVGAEFGVPCYAALLQQ